MKSLFFSYGHDDYKNFILKIRDYLQDKGYTTFVDSDKLKATDDWEYKLEVAINNHEKVLFFITPHSARRPNGYCLNEIAMALYKEKEIIPVMIDFEIPPLSLARLQYLDLQNLAKGKTNDTLFEQQMQELIDVLENKKTIEVEGNHINLLKDLKPINFTQDFAKHKKLIGRKWVSPKIDQWITNNPESRILWLTANAGYGKSAIATYLANHHKNVIGIHYCAYNYPEKKNPINVIKTLAYQCNSQLPQYSQLVNTLDIEHKNEYKLFEKLILNPLYQLDIKTPLLFIIDALDEAKTDDGNNKLSDLIRDEFHKLSKNIKIIITSRPEPKLQQQFAHLNPIVLKADDEENKNDCKEFIKNGLAENGYIKYFSDAEFMQSLLEKSEYNMLYLKSFFNEVKNGMIDINSPNQFPKGLNGVYTNFFERITTNEDEFDEKLAPLLEVIVAYEHPIPTLLLTDILGLNQKRLKRLLHKLGGILKIQNNTIAIYHKSVQDWLLSENNYDYPLSYEDGVNYLHDFYLQLKNYKKEYLPFFEFNKELANYYYNKDENLNTYLRLLEDIEHNEEKVSLLQKLALSYNEILQIKEAILLGETSLNLTAKLFQEKPKQWAIDYTKCLNNLALSYSEENRIQEAIALLEKSLDIIEKLYQKKPNQWADIYSATLNSFAISIMHFNVDQAIDLQEKAFGVTKKMYQKNPKLWVDKYLIRLNNLATYYKKANRYTKAIEIELMVLNDSNKLFKNNRSKWIRIYVTSLNNLAHSLNKTHHVNEAIELLEESLEIVTEEYCKKPKIWVREYTINLVNLANCYSDNNNHNLAIALEKQALDIREVEYRKEPTLWAKDYLTCLNNLAAYYNKIHKPTEALFYNEKSLAILTKLYAKHSNIWALKYTNSLNNLATTYINLNKFSDAIDILKEIVYLREKLYQQKPSEWKEFYAMSLNNLAFILKETNQIDKAVVVEEKTLSVLTKLFLEEPIIWFQKTVFILNNLALSYKELNRVRDAISLYERSIPMLKPFEKDKQLKPLIFKTRKNLLYLYLKTNNTEKAKEIENILQQLNG